VTAAIKVRVANNEHEGLDTEGGRWSAVCETHGTLLSCDTRTEARLEARWARRENRADWCEDCTAGEAS